MIDGLTLDMKLKAFTENELSVIGEYALSETFSALMPKEQRELLLTNTTRRFSPNTVVETVVDNILFHNEWPLGLHLIPDTIKDFKMTDRQIWFAQFLYKNDPDGMIPIHYVNFVARSYGILDRHGIHAIMKNEKKHEELGPVPSNTHCFPKDVRKFGKYEFTIKELTEIEDRMSTGTGRFEIVRMLRASKDMSHADAIAFIRSLENDEI